MKLPPKKTSILSAHQWMRMNEKRNGAVVSELMDEYAKYYHEQKMYEILLKR